MITSTFVSNIWHLPVRPGIRFWQIYVCSRTHVALCNDRGEPTTCLVSTEQRVGCPGGLMLCLSSLPSPRGSVDSPADELRPCGAGHWSFASQPPCWALECPQSAEHPPYEDCVCSFSCMHQLGYEYYIGFTEEWLDTDSNSKCSSKEGKWGRLTSPADACRDATWRWAVLQGTGRNQQGATWWGCHSMSRNTRQGEEQEIWDLHLAQHPVVGDKPQCCWCSAGCNGAMEGSELLGRGYKPWHAHLQ